MNRPSSRAVSTTIDAAHCEVENEARIYAALLPRFDTQILGSRFSMALYGLEKATMDAMLQYVQSRNGEPVTASNRRLKTQELVVRALEEELKACSEFRIHFGQ